MLREVVDKGRFAAATKSSCFRRRPNTDSDDAKAVDATTRFSVNDARSIRRQATESANDRRVTRVIDAEVIIPWSRL